MPINVRGRQYRKVMAGVTPSLHQAAQEIAQSRTPASFTLRDIGVLAKQFDLPIKTTCEFLEYCEFLPSGTWQRFAEGGGTAAMLR